MYRPGTERREGERLEIDTRELCALCLTISPAYCQLVSGLYTTNDVTIWKLGRTVCVYSMVQRREREKYSRYIQEAWAPAAAPCIRPVTSCTSVTNEKETISNDIL